MSPDELFNIGLAGYLYELRSLVRIFGSDSFPELLPLFRNYEGLLRNNLGKHFPCDLVSTLANDEQVIDVAHIAGIGEYLFNCANLAAACELFHGWTIDAGTLTAENCPTLLGNNIGISDANLRQLGEIMGVRLNCGDTVRLVQVLKLLGLLPADSNHYDQLALGASMARRDRLGFHRIPGIGPERPGAEFSSTSKLNFAIKPCEPKSLVIIDNDEKLTADFKQINLTESPRIQALNADLYEGLDRLDAAIKQGNCSPRNLVTMFRLEPSALPDIPLFLAKMNSVAGPSAYFLATIGAGNSDLEFVARQSVMDELITELRKQGLSPLSIILHERDTQSGGPANPVFGLSEYASFQLIYCKLSPVTNKSRGQRATKADNPMDSESSLNSKLWNSFLPSNRMEMAQGIIDFLNAQRRLPDRPVNVLNLGAGVGETSSCLEKLHPPFLITDVDQIPYRKGLMHPRYCQGDVSKLPFRNSSYDVLFSSYTLSYLGNRQGVMAEWLRVLKPGGEAYFVFHAAHSAYLNTARQMISANMAQDFFQLLQKFPGSGFAGLYDWYCQQNFAWRMAFRQEREFLSYAHEIQVCRHLVNELADLMFANEEQIIAFFEQLGTTDISVNVLGGEFTVLPAYNANTAPMVGWFVDLRKNEVDP